MYEGREISSEEFSYLLEAIGEPSDVVVKEGLGFSVSIFNWDHDRPLRCSVKGTWALVVRSEPITIITNFYANDPLTNPY